MVEKRKRGFFFWTKQAALFPFRLLGLLFVFGCLMGCIAMWLLPSVAARQNTDVIYLVLRAVEYDNAARPFHLLKYEGELRARLMDLQPLDDGWRLKHDASALGDRFRSLETTRTPGELYQHRFTLASGRSGALETPLPHMTVTPAEARQARDDLERFFDKKDKARWDELRQWGKSLFLAAWYGKYDPGNLPTEMVPEPRAGAEEEHLWCAWRVLQGDNAAAAAELPRLPELFRQSFPDAADREAALRWARTLQENLEADYSYFQGQTAHAMGKSGLQARRIIYRTFQRVLPPRTDWTSYWLLYQYVGLSDASRQTARRRWAGYFPDAQQERLAKLGQEIARQRADAGEALPSVPDVVPVLCVVERLTGVDRQGRETREALERSLPQAGQGILGRTLQMAYPNDDFFFLLASGDPLRLFGGSEAKAEWRWSINLLTIIFLIAVLSLGVRTLLHGMAAPLVLGAANRPLWEKHLQGGGRKPWWAALASVLVFGLVGAVAAPFSLPDAILVQVGSFGQMFLAAVVATAFGGVLIAALRETAALAMVAAGVDVETTWIDEAVGLLLGGYVLHHFGNDLFEIGLFMLCDAAPRLPGLLRRKARAGSSQASPAARPLPEPVAG
jgi:hypothetical protein